LIFLFQVAGWGKTASNEADLKKFVELDRQCARSIRGYSPLYTSETPLVPDVPMFTFQEIFPKNECAEMTRGRMDASGAQFCATKRLECNFMADTCQGDSGGPFICKEPTFCKLKNIQKIKKIQKNQKIQKNSENS